MIEAISRILSAILWLGGAMWLLLFLVLVAFYMVAVACDYTGWCRVEDYMTMSDH